MVSVDHRDSQAPRWLCSKGLHSSYSLVSRQLQERSNALSSGAAVPDIIQTLGAGSSDPVW